MKKAKEGGGKVFEERCLNVTVIPGPKAPRQLRLFGSAEADAAVAALYGTVRQAILAADKAVLYEFIEAQLESPSLIACGGEKGWRLLFTTGGRGRLAASSQTLTMTAGDGVLLRADVPCTYAPADEGQWQMVTLRFHESALALLPQRLKKTRPNTFHFNDQYRFKAAACALLDVCEQRRKRRPVAVREALQSLVGMFFVESDHLPEPVAKVRCYILEHYAEDMDAAALVAASGISHRHLIRLFDEYTGMSPMSYLAAVRADQARLLLSTNLSISEVAQCIGMPSEQALRAAFRERYGCAPSEYRERMAILAERIK